MDGVILIDKPAGKTSHDIVYGVRRTVGKGVKVGHAGTLDPFATGLLLVLVGRATRVQRWFMGLPARPPQFPSQKDSSANPRHHSSEP